MIMLGGPDQAPFSAPNGPFRGVFGPFWGRFGRLGGAVRAVWAPTSRTVVQPSTLQGADSSEIEKASRTARRHCSNGYRLPAQWSQRSRFRR